MIKTIIKTHICDAIIDKFIDAVCTNLEIYPEMYIQLIKISGRVYVVLDDYVLYIKSSFWLRGNKPRYNVISKVPNDIDKYTIYRETIIIPYTIDNDKIANHILNYIKNNSRIELII